MKHFYLFFFFVIGFAGFLSSQPVSNPYADKYPNTEEHWTFGINWENIVDISDHGAVNDGDTDNHAALASAIAALPSEGGVIFFPAGKYFFNDDVILPANVILRGATPVLRNAKDSLFAPPSKLLFPKYEPVFSGDGTPDSTAFKSITNEAGARNIGLIYLDINRARVEFKPHNWQFVEVPGGDFNVGGKDGTYRDVGKPANVIVFGCRSNNTAIPDNRIGPGASQGTWERWSWRFAANIDLYVKENGCVCNNRLNDSVTDNYLQPGYLGLNCGSGYPSDGSGATFDYTKHYGIVLNRAKNNQEGDIEGNYVTGGHNDWGVMGFITGAGPTQEPILFAPGNEVRDNWVYRTRRVGIHAAGTGLAITGNEIYDKQGKKNYLTIDGTGCNTNNSATLENRGIDFSGWDVLIDNNYLEAFVDRLGGSYPSIDGEGILMQECCGGTKANDYTITNNTIVGDAPNNTNPAISLYKVKTISNTFINNNEVKDTYSSYNGYIYIAANTNNTDFPIYNTTVSNNTAKSINFSGIEGADVKAEENTAWQNNAGGFTTPCFVELINNTGFSSYDTGNCAETVPTIAEFITSSQSVNKGGQLTLEGTIVSGNTNAEIGLLQGDTILDTLYPTGGNVSYNWDIPTQSGIYPFTLIAGDIPSEVIHIKVEVPANVATDQEEIQEISSNKIKIFPNPVKDHLNIIIPDFQSNQLIKVFDYMGKVKMTKKCTNFNTQINTSSLESGIYIIKTGTFSGKFIKH